MIAGASGGQRLINQSPGPRLLVRGFDGEEDLVTALLAECPTARRIASLREVRQAEWDVLVTDRPLFEEKLGDFGPAAVYTDASISVLYRAPRSPGVGTHRAARRVGGGRRVQLQLHRVGAAAGAGIARASRDACSRPTRAGVDPARSPSCVPDPGPCSRDEAHHANCRGVHRDRRRASTCRPIPTGRAG